MRLLRFSSAFFLPSVVRSSDALRAFLLWRTSRGLRSVRSLPSCPHLQRPTALTLPLAPRYSRPSMRAPGCVCAFIRSYWTPAVLPSSRRSLACARGAVCLRTCHARPRPPRAHPGASASLCLLPVPSGHMLHSSHLCSCGRAYPSHSPQSWLLLPCQLYRLHYLTTFSFLRVLLIPRCAL